MIGFYLNNNLDLNCVCIHLNISKSNYLFFFVESKKKGSKRSKIVEKMNTQTHIVLVKSEKNTIY